MPIGTNRDRRSTIAGAISDELDRQSRAGAVRLDTDSLAGAIERALDGEAPMSARAQMRQAKRPSELNATNDG